MQQREDWLLRSLVFQGYFDRYVGHNKQCGNFYLAFRILKNKTLTFILALKVIHLTLGFHTK